jgi:hypothetical protein
VLCGPEKDLNIIIPKITDITGAKGKLINGEFRGKLLTCQEKDILIAHEFVNTYQLS